MMVARLVKMLHLAAAVGQGFAAGVADSHHMAMVHRKALQLGEVGSQMERRNSMEEHTELEEQKMRWEHMDFVKKALSASQLSCRAPVLNSVLG